MSHESAVYGVPASCPVQGKDTIFTIWACLFSWNLWPASAVHTLTLESRQLPVVQDICLYHLLESLLWFAAQPATEHSLMAYTRSAG